MHYKAVLVLLWLQPLQKKIPSNPKYQHVQATVDSGLLSMTVVSLLYCMIDSQIID